MKTTVLSTQYLFGPWDLLLQSQRPHRAVLSDRIQPTNMRMNLQMAALLIIYFSSRWLVLSDNWNVPRSPPFDVKPQDGLKHLWRFCSVKVLKFPVYWKFDQRSNLCSFVFNEHWIPTLLQMARLIKVQFMVKTVDPDDPKSGRVTWGKG